MEPGALTRAVRAARDLRGLLSSEIASESGVSTETVISVLSDNPTQPNAVEAQRLSAWAAAALPAVIDLNDPDLNDPALNDPARRFGAS